MIVLVPDDEERGQGSGGQDLPSLWYLRRQQDQPRRVQEDGRTRKRLRKTGSGTGSTAFPPGPPQSAKRRIPPTIIEFKVPITALPSTFQFFFIRIDSSGRKKISPPQKQFFWEEIFFRKCSRLKKMLQVWFLVWLARMVWGRFTEGPICQLVQWEG